MITEWILKLEHNT